ncbi:MAG: JAB domain-containing protein [Clostridia bacterium]
MKEQKKHSHNGHRQRLKLKALEAGIEHWPHHEVLELLLTYTIPYKDVNPLAHELINTFGSLGNVIDAGYEQLKKIDGIGHETALFLTLLPDIMLKYTASKNVDSILMDAPNKVVEYFRSIDRVRGTERFYVFCLNGQKKLAKTLKFDSEFSSSVNISTSSVAKKILATDCKRVVILHTHPSGICQPTDLDIDATKKLISSLVTIGVDIADHIIVTHNQYYSFAGSLLMDNLKKLVAPDIYK